MSIATVTSKGQVTIPKEVREVLRIEAGDRIDFIVESENRVVVRKPGREIKDLYGLLYRRGRKALTVEEMDRAIGRHHARENARIKNARR